MTENDDRQHSNTANFVILSVLLIGFILAISYLGYLAALIFFGIGAGFVLWWSRHGINHPTSTSANED